MTTTLDPFRPYLPTDDLQSYFWGPPYDAQPSTTPTPTQPYPHSHQSLPLLQTSLPPSSSPFTSPTDSRKRRRPNTYTLPLDPNSNPSTAWNTTPTPTSTPPAVDRLLTPPLSTGPPSPSSSTTSLPKSGGPGTNGASSAFRNVSACNRCRLRKNRCDQRLPACSSCEKADVKCVGYDPLTKREVPRSYVFYLEQRVNYFENLLSSHGLRFLPAERFEDLPAQISQQHQHGEEMMVGTPVSQCGSLESAGGMEMHHTMGPTTPVEDGRMVMMQQVPPPMPQQQQGQQCVEACCWPGPVQVQIGVGGEGYYGPC